MAVLIFSIIVIGVFAFFRVQEYLNADDQAPVITAESETIQASVNVTDEELLAGMTAQDNLDGDVTGSLVVVSKTRFSSIGVRKINYAAFDRNNNVGKLERTIEYTDYVSPHFVLKQPLRFPTGNSSNDFLAHMSVEDCLDGDLTGQIKITFGTTEASGMTTTEQDVNVTVTNSAGDNASLVLNASFEDYATYSQYVPALQDYIVYVKKGEKPDLEHIVTGIWSAGNILDASKAGFNGHYYRYHEDNVDYNTPGVYTVRFSLIRPRELKDEITLGESLLTVVVEE